MTGKPLILLETGSYCLLCLKRSTLPLETSHFFPDISEYVKMHRVSVSTSARVTLLEQYDMKGKMCRGCALLSQNFSQFLQSFKMVRMKLNSCFKAICGAMGEIIRDDVEQFKAYMMGGAETSIYHGFVERLRKETLEQSTLLLNHVDGAVTERIVLEPQADESSRSAPFPAHKSSSSSSRSSKNVKPSWKYKCHICSQQFSRTQLCQDHIRVVHHGHKFFSCEHCHQSRFLTRRGKDEHLKLCTKRPPGQSDKIKPTMRYPNRRLKSVADIVNDVGRIRMGDSANCSKPGAQTLPVTATASESAATTSVRVTKCKFCPLFINDLPTHMYYAHSKVVPEVDNYGGVTWSEPREQSQANSQPEVKATEAMVVDREEEEVADSYPTLVTLLSSSSDSFCDNVDVGLMMPDHQNHSTFPGWNNDVVFQDPDIEIGEVKLAPSNIESVQIQDEYDQQQCPVEIVDLE